MLYVGYVSVAVDAGNHGVLSNNADHKDDLAYIIRYVFSYTIKFRN